MFAVAFESSYQLQGLEGELLLTSRPGVGYKSLLNLYVSVFRPAHGGKYCIGEWKKYKLCNTQVQRQVIISSSFVSLTLTGLWHVDVAVFGWLVRLSVCLFICLFVCLFSPKLCYGALVHEF